MSSGELESTPFTNSVHSSELRPGAVYFRLVRVRPDDEPRIPSMEPLIFLARSQGAHGEELHFQDGGAHAQGIRRDSGVPAHEATFHRLTAPDLGSIFVFARALEELIACSLGRTPTTHTDAAFDEPLLRNVISLRRGAREERAEVVVGKPAQSAGDEWSCPIQIDGQQAGELAIYGSGALASLANGLKVLRRLRRS